MSIDGTLMHLVFSWNNASPEKKSGFDVQFCFVVACPMNEVVCFNVGGRFAVRNNNKTHWYLAVARARLVQSGPVGVCGVWLAMVDAIFPVIVMVTPVFVWFVGAAEVAIFATDGFGLREVGKCEGPSHAPGRVVRYLNMGQQMENQTLRPRLRRDGYGKKRSNQQDGADGMTAVKALLC